MDIRRIIDRIPDISLRITMQILHILTIEPGMYSARELAEELRCTTGQIVMAIEPCLKQNAFEFYAGSTRITYDNIQQIPFWDNGKKLSVVTRISFTDREGYDRFYAMKEDYSKSVLRRSFKKIVAFNSYKVADNMDKAGTDTPLIKLLSEGTTEEHESLIDGSHFYPFAFYNSRPYNREYLVALEEDDNGSLMVFFPCECSKKVMVSTAKEKEKTCTKKIQISKIYPDAEAINEAREKLKSIWGPHSIYLDEEPFTVSATVYDKSCIRKIRHDISSHVYNMKEDCDGTYTLNMEVLGYEAFKVWVLSYGSSIEIKEPAKMRIDIKGIYEKVKNRYS